MTGQSEPDPTGTPVQRAKRTVAYRSTSGKPSTISSSDETHGGSLAGAAILVLTQMPDRASAQALARALVEARLAACVSVGAPVESLYHWRGQIETAQEVPVAIKTRAERVRRGRGGDPRAPPLRTSGDRRCPRHRWTRPLPRLDRRRNRGALSVAARRLAGVGAGGAGARAAGAAAARRPKLLPSRSARSRSASQALDDRTVEARFAIADGYYLYRDKLKFAVEPAALAGAPALPAGQGQGRPVLRQGRNLPRPARRHGCRSTAPSPGATVTVKAESQGCADAGVCYPPQVQKRHRGAAGAGRPARRPGRGDAREEILVQLSARAAPARARSRACTR